MPATLYHVWMVQYYLLTVTVLLPHRLHHKHLHLGIANETQSLNHDEVENAGEIRGHLDPTADR